MQKGIKRGISASFLAHAAFLVGALAVLPAPSQAPIAEEQPVVVDISNISEKTATKATTKQDVPKTEKPAAEKTEVTKDVKPAPKVAEEIVEAAKEKAAEPEKQPEPVKKPEENPDTAKLEELLMAQAEAEQKAEAEKKAAEEAELALKKKQQEEQKKKAEAEQKKLEEQKKKEAEAKKKKEAEEKRKKAEDEKRKKQKLDMAELEKLLNKENDERTAPKKSSDTAGSPDQGQQEIQGDDAEAKASFRDALVSRIRECFRPPPASLDDNVRIRVTLLINLNEDGTLKGAPRPQFTGIPLADAVAEAASSAVVECQPYNFFPPGKYKGYSSWQIEFDPKDL